MIDALAEGLDVRLATPAAAVEYDELAARVRTSADELLEADRVIVTVPLGVLKAGALAFSPPLPVDKLTALGRLEMGSLEKVVLRFESAFWSAAGEGDLAWLYLGEARGEFPFIVDITPDAGAPTLVLLHGGARAREQLDVRDDDTLVADALLVLERLHGGPIPAPLASHVTRWRSDPWSRGSYSFPALGQSMEDFDRLAAPVGDRVLFAGEATSRPYFGTVHGAVHSAIREAARLGVDGSGLPGV
ncbi:MAG: FAD-dependent oxidoreductase [Nannocystis sp.]|nr:FAD-dependent oxidoreductase [Nannocystis sp.]